MRRLPGPADHRPGDGGDSRGSLRIVSGLAENPNSIFCDGSHGARGSKWMSGSAECRNQPPRGERAQRPLLIGPATRSPERARKTRAFLLTKTYMDAGYSTPSLCERCLRMPMTRVTTKVAIATNELTAIVETTTGKAPMAAPGPSSGFTESKPARCHRRM
jgi:predicted phage gp36 major capsid-like protein